MEFKPFPKMARLSRECIITEKLDGTNAQICIAPAYLPEGATDAAGSLGTFDNLIVWAGSRTRWITPGKTSDNYGFAGWVLANVKELLKLGPGSHFGEWWGAGIQRGYGLTEKRFSLFNAGRWGGCPQNKWAGLVDLQTGAVGPACCSVVPVLYRGEFNSYACCMALGELSKSGSVAAPGFMNPEGIIVYHVAAGIGFKKTYDDGPKGESK